MKRLGLLLFAGLVACGQAGDAPAPVHPQAAEVRTALGEMLKHTTDPFLIVEDPGTEKFIQFYNDGGRILMDLPEGALEPGEIERARGYFARYGVPLETSHDTDPDTGETFASRTWTKTYPAGRADEVTQIALGALADVYGISATTRLALTKGWE